MLSLASGSGATLLLAWDTEEVRVVEVTEHAGARCVVLGDAPGCVAVREAITAAGYTVSVVVERWPDVLAAAVEVDADVAVIDLATVGHSGVRLIAALRVLAPRCRIVVLSGLRAIDLPVAEAGVSLVDPTDLRPLTAALNARVGRPVER